MEIKHANEIAGHLVNEMSKAVLGQQQVLIQMVVALLAGGHALLEGVPGTAKTLIARAVAHVSGVSFKRIQFTPDLMPSDIVGVNMFNTTTGKFTFVPGPIFADIVLADEINRAPAKTQSALLEAMEERQSTVDGIRHPMSAVFTVFATQNPVEFEGTYPLPEAQVDRFMLKILVNYPPEKAEAAILDKIEAGFNSFDLTTASLQILLDRDKLVELQRLVRTIRVEEPVRRYTTAIVRGTRTMREVSLRGALYEPLVAIGVIYLMFLAVYVLFDALLLPGRRQLQIKRHMPERVSLGVGTAVTFEIVNNSRRQVQIQLAEDLPEHMEAKPCRLSGTFEPGARGQLQYRLWARKRGHYRLEHVDVRCRPAMGLLCRQLLLKLSADVHVFPNLVNLRRYNLMLRRGLTREQSLARLRQIGQGSEFESLRAFVAGDDMSRIDWKATAKRSKLIVKNFQAERQQSVLVSIDVGRATAGEFGGISRLDYLINAALMLAYVALRQGDYFSLLAFSDRIESYLPPIRRLGNIDRVSRALYTLEPRLVESDYGNACRFLSLKNRKRSLICFMTDVIDRQASTVIISYLARFARRHLPLAVTLADPDVRALAQKPLSSGPDPYAKAVALDVLAARREALLAMRQYGVAVLDVEPKQLTPELINRYLEIKSARRL